MTSKLVVRMASIAATPPTATVTSCARSARFSARATSGSSSTMRMRLRRVSGATAGRIDAVRDTAAGRTGAMGRVTRMVVPSPTLLSTAMAPPMLVTISWQTARPRPVPRPMGLVVKNGSKMRVRFSGGIPAPVSCTSMTITPSLARAVTAMRFFCAAPSGMACAAFKTRFKMTCPRRAGRPVAGGTAARSSTSWARPRTSFDAMRAVDSMTSRTSTMPTSSFSARENMLRSRTMSRTRSSPPIASAASCRSSLRGTPVDAPSSSASMRRTLSMT